MGTIQNTAALYLRKSSLDDRAGDNRSITEPYWLAHCDFPLMVARQRLFRPGKQRRPLLRRISQQARRA